MTGAGKTPFAPRVCVLCLVPEEDWATRECVYAPSHIAGIPVLPAEGELPWQEAPCTFCGRMVMQGAEHAEDCASNTGLFPVLGQDLTEHGFGCTVCGYQFKTGDFYTHRPVADGPISIVSVVCMDCAAFDREGEPE